jgi:hypothetical protein
MIKVKAELGWSKRADGSCLLQEQGDIQDKRDLSAVLVAVYGPCAVKSKIELVDRATVQVILSPLCYPPGGENDVWAGKLEQVLQDSIILVEEHPRSLIQVAVQPLNVGPNFLPILVNTVFLALLHSAVPLKRPFVGLSFPGPCNIFICDGMNGSVLFQDCEGGLPNFDRALVFEFYNNMKELYIVASK